MDRCRLSIAATGAFLHPLGQQTPIDCRYGEFLPTVDLAYSRILQIKAVTCIPYGDLVNPRCVIVWNVSGQGLQVRPTEEEAAAIAAQVLLVGLVEGDGDATSVQGWQWLKPADPGSDLAGNTILWLAPGTRVVVRPADPNTYVMARVLVLPGQ